MKYFEVSETIFLENFDHLPFTIKHHLADHPLLKLPQLIDLSKKLPSHRVEYNDGNIPISLEYEKTPRSSLTVEETIRRIEEHNSWLVMKNIELVPEYKELLEACVRELGLYAGKKVSGICSIEGFIFISSPTAVTPYHMDHEHNFLLQIKGQKFIAQFDRSNRAIISEEDIEHSYRGGHRNMYFRDELDKQAFRFTLEPGIGLFFPATAPHYVRVGNEYSISLSVTFRSHQLNRRECIYRVNTWLRDHGIKPTPFGKSPIGDFFKFLPFQFKKILKKFGHKNSARK